MTEREQQAAEIRTIKPREITINLSDADVERLFVKAYSNGLTPSKLIEGFLGDLLDGTYSHGSDERDLADEYFERCSYDMGLERSFLHWALNGGWYDELEEAIIGQDYMLEQLEYAKTVKGLSKKQIQEGIDTCNFFLKNHQENISECYGTYVEYKRSRNEEPQPLEDGIEEIRQYRRSLNEMRGGDGNDEYDESDDEEDDEQFEP